MPCPAGIDVPRIFEIYNDAILYDDPETARSTYRSELHAIALCSRCGLCEERCVKKLPILDWLDRSRQLLDYASILNSSLRLGHLLLGQAHGLKESVKPINERFIEQLGVLRLEYPMPFIGKIQELRFDPAALQAANIANPSAAGTLKSSSP